MHQKNNAATTSAHSAEIEGGDEADESKMEQDSDTILRNPFEDDGGDVDDDSDDGLGEEGNSADTWAAGRGSWWMRRGKERFGDGRDDSDSDKDETAGDEEDEEFGDFAMPEVDKTGDNEKASVIVKPLPVHPPPQNQKSSAFTLWPFGSKDKEKQKSKEGDESENRGSSGEPQEVRGEDGEKLKSTHEAKRRTSIEEPDDEEVVV